MERHPVHRPAGVEEIEEDNYPEELKSERIIASTDLSDNDYDFDYDNYTDKIPVSAERSIGGDSFQTYMSEQRGYPSMPSIDPDTFRKFTPRLSKTTQVKDMATPNDSTRRGLPHIFSMSGQTEATQAQSEVERSAAEKESRFESLVSELLSKLRTMEIAMSTMEAMHVKQVEAIHASYKRMHGSRSTEDLRKEGAMQIAMDSKRSTSRPSSNQLARKSRTQCTNSRRTWSS